MTLFRHFISLLPALWLCACSSGPDENPGDPDKLRPVVTIWNYAHMLSVREALASGVGDEEYRPAYDSLVQTAEIIYDKIINKNQAGSVMDKDASCVVPSGDKHDFVTVGKYSWPNPDTPDGLPWIQKDGERNPNYSKYDATRQNQMCDRLKNLGLAYFFTGEERYARAAVKVAQVWFLDPATRMTPHMEYAQVIPGLNDNHGNPPGIIEGYIFIQGLAGLALIQGSPYYTSKFANGMKEWFKEFAHWLRTSHNGTTFTDGNNNIAFARDQQLIAYDLFRGDRSSAKQMIESLPAGRLQPQILPDGAMPKELKRTLAYAYSGFNVIHMLETCEMARNIKPGLVRLKSSGSGSISDAATFLASYLGGSAESFTSDIRSKGYTGGQISGWEAARVDVIWICRRMRAFENPALWEGIFTQYGQNNPRISSKDFNFLIY